MAHRPRRTRRARVARKRVRSGDRCVEVAKWEKTRRNLADGTRAARQRAIAVRSVAASGYVDGSAGVTRRRRGADVEKHSRLTRRPGSAHRRTEPTPTFHARRPAMPDRTSAMLVDSAVLGIDKLTA